MLKRAIFGAIYVAVIVAGILNGNFVFLLLLLLLSTLAVNEFQVMTTPPLEGIAANSVALLLRSLDCIGAAVMVLTLWTHTLFLPGIVTYILYVIMRLCIQLWITDVNPLQSLACSFMSQVYVALPIALMSPIYSLSPHLQLLLFILVWVNDTFAYLSGRTFGKHKLWERISPKKTWEGFWGGTLMTIITAALCGVFGSHYFAGFSWVVMACLGMVVSIFGTLGDLVESLLKRTVGVKDSGNLIPGHGGILDRIDSILLVVPSSSIFLFFVVFHAI